jgi:hypothetical protein
MFTTATSPARYMPRRAIRRRKEALIRRAFDAKEKRPRLRGASSSFETRLPALLRMTQPTDLRG